MELALIEAARRTGRRVVLWLAVTACERCAISVARLNLVRW